MATVSEELNKLENTKADIKSALVEKGLNPTDVFSSYALNIRDIQSGGGSTEPVGVFLINNANKDNIVWPTNWADTKYIVISGDITEKSLNLPDLTIDLSSGLLIFGESLRGLNYKKSLNWNLTLDAKDSDLLKGPIITNPGTSSSTIPDNLLFNITVIGSNNLRLSSLCVYMYGNLKLNIENVNVTDVRSLFLSSFISKLTLVGDFSKCTDFNDMFWGAEGNSDLIFKTIDTSNGVDFSNMFYSSTVFNEVEPLNTSKGTDFSSMFNYSSIIKVHEISFKGCNKNYYSNMIGSNVRYALIKDIGTISTFRNLSFSDATKWGIEDSSIPLSAGARQSVIDSLITYSFDRAAAGYPEFTIKLSSATKALLTEEEIAQITAKGITIA